MLTSLTIKNLALIEDLALEFTGGLNVFTGETGAGKTIVMEALGLALGDKASAQQVRKGASRSTVSAEFDSLPPRVAALLRETGLLSSEQVQDNVLVVRREVEASGRSRAFVNDSPVNLLTLSKLGEQLVYLHGQHEHQLLLKPAEQRELLDTFGRHEEARAAVVAAYGVWRDLTSEQQALSLSEQERAQRVDLYRFQLNELKAAALKNPDEEEDLERLLPQLKNAERLKNLSGEAYGLLYGQDGAALDNVRRVQRDLETLQSYGADLAGTVEAVQEAVVRLEEASQSLDAFHHKVDLDPERLDGTLSRMDLLGKLKRKYGPALADVIAHRDRIEEELKHLENAEERTRDLAGRLAAARKDLAAAAAKLTQSRAASAKRLAAAVEKEFRDVGLPRARFGAAVRPRADGDFTAHGADEVAFLFAPNPGEGDQPLADVASGGELSRVMLALKTVLAKADPVGTLVFDEIDAGVGGALGGALGRKLAKLGRTHQVLCVTHLASVAACAQTHFLVEKQVRKDRTATLVRRLPEEERVREIARMFGGVEDAGKESVSLRHARELLKSASGE